MSVNVSSTVYLGTAFTISWDSMGVGVAYTVNVRCGSYMDSISTLNLSQSMTLPHNLANNWNGNTNYPVTVLVTSSLGRTEATSTRAYIPATPIDAQTNATLGVTDDAVTTYTPTATSLKYGVKYILNSGGSSISFWTRGGSYIEPGSTSQQTESSTLPMTWANYITTGTSIQVTVQLYTYTSNNIQVGYKQKYLTATVPSSIAPTFNYSLAEGVQSGFGVYTTFRSTLEATFTDVTAQYGASITSAHLRVGSLLKNLHGSLGSNFTIESNPLVDYDAAVPVELSVVDSRGMTTTQTTTITVYEYFKPAIGSLSISVSGTTVQVDVDHEIAPVNNLNAKKITIVRTKVSTQTSTTVVNNATLLTYSGTYTLTETIADVDVESYEYSVTINDTFNSATLSKSTGIICLSRLAGGLGVTFFKEASQQGVWIRDVQYDISDAEFRTLAETLAKEYSTTRAYSVGDFCWRSSTLYRCINNTSGTWTAADWEAL